MGMIEIVLFKAHIIYLSLLFFVLALHMLQCSPLHKCSDCMKFITKMTMMMDMFPTQILTAQSAQQYLQVDVKQV